MLTSFTPYQSTALLLPSGSTPGPGSYAGFVVSSGAVPAALTLEQGLAASGAFVFFNGLPSDPVLVQEFAAAMAAYLQGSGRGNVKFVWFGAADSFVLTSAQQLEVVASGGGFATGQLTAFIWRNLTLNITGQAAISVSSDQQSFLFTPLASAPHRLNISSTAGQNDYTDINGALTLDVLGGDGLAGTFSGTHPFTGDNLENFDVGLKYVTPSVVQPGFTEMANARLFDLAAPSAPASLTMAATIDPTQPENPARTFWAFAPSGPLPLHLVNAVGVQFGAVPSNGAPGQQPARLTLCKTVAYAVQPGVPPTPSQIEFYYFVPSGDFALSLWSAANPPPGSASATLMPGLSGAEYFALDATSTTLRFETGHNAYAMPSDVQGNSQQPSGAPPPPVFTNMTADATTAWATLLGGSAPVTYFAQPRQAVQHQPPATAPAANAAAFLNFLPLIAGAVPNTPAQAPMFPFVAYRGLTGTPNMTPDLAQAMENQLLAPLRRKQIPVSAQTGQAGGGNPAQGATAQGFLLGLSQGNWSSLSLATTSDTTYPGLSLANITGAMQNAFLTDPLMVVFSDPAKFQQYASYAYCLTTSGLNALLESQQIPQSLHDTVQNSPNFVNSSYPSRAAFSGALQTVMGDPGLFKQYSDVFFAQASVFTLDIAGWNFDLSTESWNNHGTILLFKFMRQPLSVLAQSTAAWFQKGDIFNANAEATRQNLQAFIDQSRSSTDPDMQDFVTNVIDNPNWQGMLAINAQVPLSKLPAQLEGLAAGIDPQQFFAHHVGVRMTPLEPNGSGIAQKISNTFGLINYQAPNYLQSGNPYDFKVLSLKALFDNADLIGFSSQVDLYVGALFGDSMSCTLGAVPGTNNLIFNGVYQKSSSGSAPGIGTYTFTTSMPTIYQSAGAVLNRIEIVSAQFVTLTPSAQQLAENQVSTQFLLTGTMSFNPLPVDLFSYGADQPSAGQVEGLVFSGLSIDMDFVSATPSYKTFAFDAARISFDATASKRRSTSLAAHFPIKLLGLSSGSSGSSNPSNTSYMPVDIALSTSALGTSWYALNFQLNLGSLGALASAAGFVAKFVLAWSPGGSPSASNYPIYVGLGLPGVKNGDRSIPLESIIKLSFGDISLLTQGSSYILAIRQIALKLLALSFPSVGQTSLYIFGDPANESGNVGWYGGYAEPEINKGNGGSQQALGQGGGAS